MEICRERERQGESERHHTHTGKIFTERYQSAHGDGNQGINQAAISSKIILSEDIQCVNRNIPLLATHGVRRRCQPDRSSRGPS
jgi:hypothetical protein